MDVGWSILMVILLLLVQNFAAFTETKSTNSDCRNNDGGVWLNARDTENYITSPGYPNDYSNNLLCEWTISTGQCHLLLFQVIDIDLETGFDTLTLRRNFTTSDIEHTFRVVDEMYFSSPNPVVLRFRTDLSDTERGFKLSYRTISSDMVNISAISGCPRTNYFLASSEEKYILSPRYPAVSGGAFCYWVISMDKSCISYGTNDGAKVFKININDFESDESYTEIVIRSGMISPDTVTFWCLSQIDSNFGTSNRVVQEVPLSRINQSIYIHKSKTIILSIDAARADTQKYKLSYSTVSSDAPMIRYVEKSICRRGLQLTMTCAVDNADSNVTWKHSHNNVVIREIPGVTSDNHTYRLSQHDCDLQNRGTYMCVAMTTDGHSENSTVTTSDPYDFPAITNNMTVKINGAGFVIEAQVVSFPQYSSLSWMKDGRVIGSCCNENVSVESTSGVLLPMYGVLVPWEGYTIKYFGNKRYSNMAGSYQLVVTNSVGTSSQNIVITAKELNSEMISKCTPATIGAIVGSVAGLLVLTVVVHVIIWRCRSKGSIAKPNDAIEMSCQHVESEKPRKRSYVDMEISGRFQEEVYEVIDDFDKDKHSANQNTSVPDPAAKSRYMDMARGSKDDTSNQQIAIYSNENENDQLYEAMSENNIAEVEEHEIMLDYEHSKQMNKQ